MLICFSNCSGVRKDEDFARNFLIGLKAGDPSIAADMDSALVAQAGTWQVVATSLQARLPAGNIDSAVFVSLESRSSLPSTVRIVKLNVFGEKQRSLAEVFLETARNGRRMVNTIRVTGPMTLP
jgi:hypothetical protein